MASLKLEMRAVRSEKDGSLSIQIQGSLNKSGKSPWWQQYFEPNTVALPKDANDKDLIDAIQAAVRQFVIESGFVDEKNLALRI